MNIQTERLEDHRARFTVEIEPERLEKAKRAAARKMAKTMNIPGFRKGKAPYNILIQYGFEANILNDAVDDLSQEIYRETLEQVEDIEPYGPGAWEDFKLEDAPTFIYTVPLQPTIELGDYRVIRDDYEAPEVDDDLVSKAMRRLQHQEAVAEETDQPVAVGHRVTVDIHSEFADDSPETEASAEETDAEVVEEAEEHDHDHEDGEEHDHDHSHSPAKGDEFVHEHDAAIDLDPEDEPILPGFINGLVGANAGEDVEFELTIPDDEPDYEEFVGRKVKFHVTIKKVENVTMPELNDELAARITENEEEPLTLLQLRMRMRENLETEAKSRYDNQFANGVLDQIVEVSSVAFPEAMTEDQIEGMIKDFDQRLRQQGMSIDTYMKVTGMTKEQIAESYQEPAVNTIKRSLVLSKLIDVEKIKVTQKEIDAQIDKVLEQFGPQAASLRSAFDTPAMRDSIVNDVTRDKIYERIIAIAKGDDVPHPDDIVEEEDEEVVEVISEAVVAEEATAEETSTDEAEDSENAEAVVAEAESESTEVVSDEETAEEDLS
ncbi:MAG: trigger factor [Aggregatilineales bacterium]